MRIARVRPHDTARDVLALERDGAVYDVSELEDRFATRYAPSRFHASDDFATRVLALGADGLGELDRRLLAGSRPTEARLVDTTFLWLAPIDTERALVIVTDGARGRPTALSARRAEGHDAHVAIARAEGPSVAIAIGAVLGEDVAPSAANEGAIAGYVIVAAWRDDERDPALQLGPVLVTRKEHGGNGEVRVGARVDRGGEATTIATRTLAFPTFADRITRASEAFELRAGDVVVSEPLLEASAPSITFGDRVEIAATRLGKLVGTAIARRS